MAIALDESQKTPQQKQGETPQEYGKRQYKRWMQEIDEAKKVFKPYWERGRKIVQRYKDERKHQIQGGTTTVNSQHSMNILWSNVQTLQPAIYSRDPNPNVSRRFGDQDAVGRCAALIMERLLKAAMDYVDFSYPMKRARDDYLLPGRGTVWVRYEPVMGPGTLKEPLTQITLQGTVDEATGQPRQIYRPSSGGDEVPADQVKYDDMLGPYYETTDEIVLSNGMALDHVVWSDFLHEPVNDWKKVGWIAKRILMKRPKLVKSFGDKGKSVELTKVFSRQTYEQSDLGTTQESQQPDSAEVWEVWCETDRKAYWVSDGLKDDILKAEDDPLKLTNFWPCPRPLFATTSTDSLIPVPDYALYQDQAEQLDKLTDRIRLLIKALRVVGAYNGAIAELSRLLDETDENEMISIPDWAAFAQTQGFDGNMDFLPIEGIANVLKGLFEAKAQIKQELYEITGMSDIIRGASNPNETATAQQIKGNFATLRLQDRQTEMARFARDTLRIMGEAMVEHYDDQAIIDMSGIMFTDEAKPAAQPQPQQMPGQPPVAPQPEQQSVIAQAIALLRQDKLRSFRVDVETDATVAQDQTDEKQSRVEFLQAVSMFLDKAVQAGQAAPQMVPLMLDMLSFGVRGFRAGRTIEAAIDEASAQMRQMAAQQAAQPQQGPPPDPVAQAKAAQIQVETQAKQQEAASQAQIAQIKTQTAQLEAAARVKQLDAEANAANAEAALRQQTLQNEFFSKQIESQKRLRMLDLQIAKLEQELATKGTLAQAEIAQSQRDQAEQIALGGGQA